LPIGQFPTRKPNTFKNCHSVHWTRCTMSTPSFETHKTFRVCPCQTFFMFEPFPSFVSYHAHHNPGVNGSGWAFDKHAQKQIPFHGTLLGSSSRLTFLLQLSNPSINRIASISRDPSGTLLTFLFCTLWNCIVTLLRKAKGLSMTNQYLL
jgi:hypothetical protein